MAKIKTLKKDIDFLTAAVVDDCVLGMAFSDNKEEILHIIDEVDTYRMQTRSNLRNHPKFEGRKETRAYYRNIILETLRTVDSGWSKLSEIIKSHK